MEEVNSRYHVLGHAFNGCPSYRRIVENESERIAHGCNISRQRAIEHVEREGFNAIADRELVALGKFLARWQEPRQEPVVRVDRCAARLEPAGGAT